MRHFDLINREIKNTKEELYRLQAKLERLEEEKRETVNKMLEES